MMIIRLDDLWFVAVAVCPSLLENQGVRTNNK
jgi:hypothetical protein